MHKVYYAISAFPTLFHFMSIFRELVPPLACCVAVSQRIHYNFQVTRSSQQSTLLKIIILTIT
jgi:hypothetical protein